MIAPRLRIRLPSAPKDGTPSQRQWFAAVTNWINSVVDDAATPVTATQDKVTRRSLQIDMVDNTPDLEKPLSQAAQARFTAIQESLARLTASTSVTVISDWDVAATGATPTTAKSGMYFRATTAGTVGAVPLNIGDVVLFYLDNTGALQWIIVDSPAERSAAYTPADWAATTGVARIENKPTLFGLSSLLTGLGPGSNTAIAAADTLLAALAKLQAQINSGGSGGGGSGGSNVPEVDRADVLLHFDGTLADAALRTSWLNPDGCGYAPGQFGQALAKTYNQRGIYTTASDVFDFGAGDFTLEFWVRIDSFTRIYASLIGAGLMSWQPGCFSLFVPNESYYPARKFVFCGNTLPNGYLLSSTQEAELGRWYHVALTRAAGACRLFVDGVLQASATYTAPISFAGNGTWIGSNGWDGANSYFDGRIDELRVTKGLARYTADFSTPTAAFNQPTAILTGLPSIPGLSNSNPAAPTTLGTSGTATTASRSDHAHPLPTASQITAAELTGLGTGSATAIAAADTLLAALAKLQAQINSGGSGTNRYHAPDRLLMNFSTGPTDVYGSVWDNPDNCTFSGGALVKGPSQMGIHCGYCPALNFAFEDFTLDFWIKPYSYENIIGSVIGSGQASWQAGCCVVVLSPQGSIRLGLNTYGGDIVISHAGAVALNVYTHVRLTRASGVFKIFINGVFSASAYVSANVTLNSYGTWIGQNGWDAKLGYFDGEIKDLRAIKGYAIPDSPFDPNVPAVLPLLF